MRGAGGERDHAAWHIACSHRVGKEDQSVTPATSAKQARRSYRERTRCPDLALTLALLDRAVRTHAVRRYLMVVPPAANSGRRSWRHSSMARPREKGTNRPPRNRLTQTRLPPRHLSAVGECRVTGSGQCQGRRNNFRCRDDQAHAGVRRVERQMERAQSQLEQAHARVVAAAEAARAAADVQRYDRLLQYGGVSRQE